jgi:hypothetical protein
MGGNNPMSTQTAQGGNTSANDLVQLDFRPSRAGDCIPDATFSELVRRLTGVVSQNRDGSIVISPTPPSNKNAIWVPVDPETLNRNGPNKRYDFSLGVWIDDISAFQPFCAADGADNMLEQVGTCWRVRRRLSQIITLSVTGNGAQSLTLDAPVDGSNYAVFFTPTNDPASVRLWVTAKTSQQVTIQAAGWSSGTQNFAVTIIELN